MTNNPLQIRLVTSTEEFENLHKDWNTLLEDSHSPQPFLLWEWLFTWWEVFQDSNKKLFILAVYDAENLVSIAPFYIESRTPFFKCLRFLGEGEHRDDKIVTPYPDVIVKEGYVDQTISTLAEYLKQNSKSSFNMATFDLMQDQSTLHKLSLALNADFNTIIDPSESQFVIDLPEDSDAYMSSLSKSSRKSFRMKLNRLKDAGEVATASEDNLDTGLEIVEALNRKRWSDKSDLSVFDSEKFKRFHQNFCNRLKTQDIVKFRTLKHDSEVIAATYNLKYKDKMYSYMSGFGSSDDKRFSPMFLFDLMEIQAMIKNGYVEYDLMTSEAANNYKTKFNAKVIPLYKAHWAKKGVTNLVVSNYLKARPTLSKTFHGSKAFIKNPNKESVAAALSHSREFIKERKQAFAKVMLVLSSQVALYLVIFES